MQRLFLGYSLISARRLPNLCIAVPIDDLPAFAKAPARQAASMEHGLLDFR